VFVKPAALAAHDDQQGRLNARHAARGWPAAGDATAGDVDAAADGAAGSSEAFLALAAEADGAADDGKGEEAWTVAPRAKWLVRRRWRKAFLFVARARCGGVLA
jgi:hypothetical protein